MEITGFGAGSAYRWAALEKKQDKVRGEGFSDYLSGKDTYVPSAKGEAVQYETYGKHSVNTGNAAEGSQTDNADGKETEEAHSETNIIVKPDGSRVLVVTMRIGGMETTMSVKISEPTDMQNDSGTPGSGAQQGELREETGNPAGDGKE